MRKRVSEIQDNDILAKPILTPDYQIILPQGATLKREYISRLTELGVLEVEVRNIKAITNEIGILRSDIEDSVKEKVKDILERHTYQNNRELVGLVDTTDNIISTILEEDRVVEKIFDIKERSTDMYEHSISICSMAILTALKLKVDKKKIHDIGVGCLLHDIGMRYSTTDFIDKDVSELKGMELAEYKKHPVSGFSSVQQESWISDISKQIILYHHERMDGSGFPLRIKEIPFECKIVNVCDAFDEMICGISEKQKKVYEAVEYLKNYKNIKFDSDIVDTFLSFTAVYPVGTHVMTNEGELAEVIAQNEEFQERPILRILKDKNGNDVNRKLIKDMVKIHNIYIEKVID